MTTNPPPRNPQALPTQTPPFLTKLYQLVSDPNTQTLVSWTDEKGLSFTVHKPSEFGRDILPKYFKHNNFSSFVRQLNQYGFHKQNPDKWMFGHDSFRRDRPDLLKNITRRRPKQSQNSNAILPTALTQNAVVEIGNYGLEGELKSLKRDKDLLIKELVVTRQKEEQLKNRCEDLETRVVSLENSSKQMQAFIMHYFSQVLQPYSEAMASRKRKRLPSSSIEEPDTMIVEQPANQVANISHPNGRSSVDALRVMMQQMGVGISRSPAQSQAQSPARSHAQPRISFEPATVQELPQEENLSTISPSRRIMPPKAIKTVALRPPALTVPTTPPPPPNASSSSVPHAPTSIVPQRQKAPSGSLQHAPQTQSLSVSDLHLHTARQPDAVPSPHFLAAAYPPVNVPLSHSNRSLPSPASPTAFLHTPEPSRTPELGFASIDTPMTNGVVEHNAGPEKLISSEDAHMANSDDVGLRAPEQDRHRVDPDVDRALEFLEDIPSTPNTSMTMDVIDNALQEARPRSKGTHLDTPDFDKAFDDKEFNISFGHEPDSVKLNGHCSSSAENERVIEDFLELSADDHGLPPPLTHLPEGTDIHALAKKIESFADP